jgi:hypothetical protein
MDATRARLRSNATEGGVMNSLPLPTVFVTQSTAHNGIVCKISGQPVELEAAFKEGFCIQPEDAPLVLTLIQNFIQNRDHSQI